LGLYCKTGKSQRSQTLEQEKRKGKERKRKEKKRKEKKMNENPSHTSGPNDKSFGLPEIPLI
jgi:hypothetical protein